MTSEWNWFEDSCRDVVGELTVANGNCGTVVDVQHSLVKRAKVSERENESTVKQKVGHSALFSC